MTENILKNKQPNLNKRYGLNLLPSGEGMLAIEALRNAPGLTPLSFDPEIHTVDLKNGSLEGLTTEGTLRHLQGLSPLRPFGDVHEEIMNKGSQVEDFYATEGIEKRKHLSGISIPLSFRGEFHKRGVK